MLNSIFYRKEVRIIFVGTLSGTILQFIAKQILKSHTELLNDKDISITEDQPLIEPLPPRVGVLGFRSLSEFLSNLLSNAITKAVVKFVAKRGLVTGLGTSTLFVVSQIDAGILVVYLQDAFQQNLPDLEKKKYALISGEKIYLDQCDQNLEYLFKLLEDKTIPFEEKQKVARSILTKYLNLKTMHGCINFILCIVLILYILYYENWSSFHILLQSLIKAIKEGRISKAVGRAIVRKLKRKGISVDPELIETVNS